MPGDFDGAIATFAFTASESADLCVPIVRDIVRMHAGEKKLTLLFL